VKLTEGKLPKPVVSDDGDKVTKSILKITWSGGKVEPGQFQEFEVSVGPLPTNVDQLVFPTFQTYSNGEVVKWTDLPKADGSEPERPAPTLKLVAADDERAGHHGAASVTPSPGPSVAPATEAAAPAHGTAGGSDGTARLLGGIGIAVGVIGAGIGIAGMRRSRG
jgi:hypothetical protein